MSPTSHDRSEQGWHYHQNMYLPEGFALNIYILRFFGCTTGHAIYTGIVAAILWQRRELLFDVKNTENSFLKVAGYFGLSLVMCLVSMVLHTTYNVSPLLIIRIAVEVCGVLLLFRLMSGVGSA